MKKLIQNLKHPINIYYFIQGYLNRIIFYKTTKAINKSFICTDCYNNGSCLECGCDIIPMFLSDKPCPLNKF